MTFITAQEVVDRIGRGTASDAGIVQAVKSACQMVQTEAGQTFTSVVGDTITMDGTGTDAIVLPELPVTHAGTVNLIDSTGSTTNITDYALTDKGVLLRNRGSTCWPYTLGWWPEGRQNVQVTYDHGFGTASFPEDVREVAISLASRLVIQGPAVEESTGPTSIKYGVNNTDLTPGEKAIVQKYRQIG